NDCIIRWLPMLFVFIGGASASGKTLFARDLVVALEVARIRAIKISLDDYYITRSKRLKPIGDDDNPVSFDFPLLRDQLHQLQSGESINKPLFSFELGERLIETVPIHTEGLDVVLIEGILALNEYESMQLKSKLGVFVETDFYLTYVYRRCVRDVNNERNTSVVETVDRELRQGVRDAFFKHILPTKHNADYAITNNYRIENGLESNIEDLPKAVSYLVSEITASIQSANTQTALSL
ncbi:MAG: uridine kinase, partial [Legionellales bacterium]